jgi:hypothetical protein
MGKVYERIDDRLRSFIEQQPIFFVATAPLAGHNALSLDGLPTRPLPLPARSGRS